jgi:uncharacterized protein (DUF2235 family)
MRLVIFADGTWNKIDAREKGTNVVKLCQATVDDRARGQIRFYDPGVGTSWYNRLRGGIFGMGVSQNIKDCYDFVVDNWSGDDEIFLFGFSRGAYTVRSLGGLINFIGVVQDPGERRARARLIDQAYALYRDANVIRPRTPEDQQKFDPERKRQYEQFVATHVRGGGERPRVRMIGVWDTVENAYHAVALDEKRKAFRPTLWEDDPRVHQVFFTGVHSDVGGGYHDDCKLGDITLGWMAEHAERHGLLLDRSRLPTLSGHEFCGKQHDSWTAVYRLVRRDHRAAPHPSRLHPSVRDRLHEPDTTRFAPHPYRPESLLEPWDGYRFD